MFSDAIEARSAEFSHEITTLEIPSGYSQLHPLETQIKGSNPSAGIASAKQSAE